MNDGNNQMLVLADGFTGANDVDVGLAEANMSVEVAFGAGQLSTAQVLILNSGSRAMGTTVAADGVTSLLCDAARLIPYWQARKIDSTLRGNLGGEPEAMMAAHGCRSAVVASAYPTAGRYTRNGCYYVHGVTFNQTKSASGPKTPVSRAEVSETITIQSRPPCLTLNAAQLSEALATAGKERRVLIVDTWEGGHLGQVIDAVAPHARETLLVGSAGFCEALVRRLCRCEQGPLLALVGLMSEMAQRQVTALQAYPQVRKIGIDVEQAFSRSSKEEASRIAEVLREGHHCVVTIRPNNAARHGVEAQCNERGLSHAAYGEHICAWLAGVTAQAVMLCPPGALYLSGGDIAIAVAHALGAAGLQIRGRMAQRMPYGHFLDGRQSQPVMTRAGGFGTDIMLLDVVNSIKEKLSV